MRIRGLNVQQGPSDADIDPRLLSKLSYRYSFLSILTFMQRISRFAWLLTLVWSSFLPIAQGVNASPQTGIKFSPPTETSTPQASACLEKEKDLIKLIIRSLPYKRVPIDNEININWHAEPTDSNTTGSAITVEEIRQEIRSGQNVVSNYSKFKESEPTDNYAHDRNEVTPSQLAQDAYRIHQKLVEGDQQRVAQCTTVLCVALMNQEKGIKKFVSCNLELLPPALRNQSKYMGYHVIRAGQSHAEGEFLQFLWKRSRQPEPAYTPIIGMGCSRKHCQECDLLLQLVLGRGYHIITAAADENGCIVEGREAVDKTKTYARYYISKELQEVIQCYTNTQLTCKERFLAPDRKKKQEAKLRKTSVRREVGSSSRTEYPQGERRNPMRTCREDAARKKR